MKKLNTLVFFLFIVFGASAQQMNSVSGTIVNSLTDGWYKYSAEDLELDIEVTAGFISQGNIKWFNEDTYSGDLRANEFSGKGTYKWANGEKYEGSFKKNQRHGKGTMYYLNGEKFSGKWKNDKPHGKGKTWKTDGTVEEGVWEDGKMVKK